MAFNPFTSFQKNQKFWMAAILLLCMTTFVFCTGMGGDMGERLQRMLFRHGGPTIVTVGSYSLSEEDLRKLRDQRNIANDFMRKCTDLSIRFVTERFKKLRTEAPAGEDKQLNEQRKKELTRLAAMQQSLSERLRGQRYFEGGVKSQELIDFKVWQAEADRLGIYLTEDDVFRLPGAGGLRGGLFWAEFFDHLPIDWAGRASMEARGRVGGDRFSENMLRQAVVEEFRVRIAQLACYEFYAIGFSQARAEHPELKLTFSDAPNEGRAHQSLAQLWQGYKAKRSEAEVTLLPIEVADLKDKVGTPSAEQLQALFEKHKKEPYNPQSPQPGFEMPHRVKAALLIADPEAPEYLMRAEARIAAETVVAPTMQIAGAQLLNGSPLGAYATLAGYATGHDRVLQNIYGKLSRSKYRTVQFGSDGYLWLVAAWNAKRHPDALAGMVGGAFLSPSNGIASLVGYGMLKEPNAVGAGVAAEVHRRTPLYAGFAVLGAAESPLMLAQVLTDEERSWWHFEPELPLAAVRPEISRMEAVRIAHRWALDDINAVLRKLEENKRFDPEWITLVLNDMVLPGKGADAGQPRRPLKYVVTDKAYNRFTIDEAKELQPLKKQFKKSLDLINGIEGREPEKVLKEEDFYKVFFGGESFSTGSANQVRVWPPAVTPNPKQFSVINPPAGLNLPPQILEDLKQKVAHQFEEGADPNRATITYKLFDKAEKPILYWKTKDEPTEQPKDLKAVKDRVEDAWKTEEARKKEALPLAKAIAKELSKAAGDYALTISDEQKKLKHPAIVLRNVSPWVPERIGPLNQPLAGRTEYKPFKLDKGLIPFPREGTGEALLNLFNLEKPIEIPAKDKDADLGVTKALNDLNTELLAEAKKNRDPKGKFVQVLTNKPQTVFYVAVVTRPPWQDEKELSRGFQQAMFNASERSFFPDTLVVRLQQEHSREFRRQLLDDLRRTPALNFSIVEGGDAKLKSLDENVGD